MTELLKKAFDAASKLTPQEQDALATLLLDELESDEHWDEACQGPADELSELADEALREHRGGRSEPLDPSVL